MVIDKWKNNSSYFALHPRMQEGMQFANSLTELPAGRYEQEHGIFALVQVGETIDITSNPMECHHRFLDIQIVISGKETIEWEEVGETKKETSYDNKKDVELRSGKGRKLTVSEGEFYIMFPQDCHKCCGNDNDRQFSYRKIVLKLPI